MNKRVLFTATLIFLTLSLITKAQIPNYSFEEWESHGSYSNPTHWDTPNEELSIMGLSTVKESQDSYDGEMSIQLLSGSLLGYVIPGVATLGEITLDFANREAKVYGGVPYDKRPTKLKGYYKYQPQPADTAAIIVAFFQYDSITGIRDTLGGGIFQATEAINQWTEFSAEIQWFSDKTPDTTNIILLSTASRTTTAGGSSLFIDHLTFDFSNNIEEENRGETQARIYPIPAKEKLHIDLPISMVAKRVHFELYNATGTKVLTSSLQEIHQQINLTSLPEGIYFYRILDHTTTLQRGKLIRVCP